jgi:hypothetical protein
VGRTDSLVSAILAHPGSLQSNRGASPTFQGGKVIAAGCRAAGWLGETYGGSSDTGQHIVSWDPRIMHYRQFLSIGNGGNRQHTEQQARGSLMLSIASGRPALFVLPDHIAAIY